MARDRSQNARRRVTTPGVRVRKLDTSTWSPKAGLQLVDDALVVVGQAFCHQGHALIGPENMAFRGFPGVRLRVREGDTVEDIVLSPIHGHHERLGGRSIPDGTRCQVGCPICDEPLEEYAPCPCGQGTLLAIYLTPDRDKAHVAAICDVWGCQRSRIVDEWEILSEAVEREAEPSDPSVVV